MQQRLDVLIANRTRLKGRKRMEEEEEVEEEEVGTSFRRFGRRTRRPLDFFIRSSLRRPRNRNVPSFYRVFFFYRFLSGAVPCFSRLLTAPALDGCVP